jgi:putative peptidoglycan lipid II flippase
MARSLLKSTSVVSGLTLVSRVLGLVREITLARAFGAGPLLDAFFIALMLPNLGRRIFAEGAFSQAFVPVFTETRTQQSHEEVRDLTAVVMGTLGAILSVVTVIGCLCAPLLVWAFAPGFRADAAQAALGADLLRWTFPYLMFISLTSMAGSILNSYGQFAVPAAAPVILNVCIIASAWISADSVMVLAYAVFVAGVLQLLSQLPSLMKLRLLPRPRFAPRDPRVARIAKLMLPVVIGSSVAQVSLLLNTSLATLIADGAVSWLNFGSRLMEFPTGIFAIAVGTVILPSLSSRHTERSPEQFSDTLDWGLRTMLLLGLPSAVGLIVLGGPLTAAIFGHGHFSDHDIKMTTWTVWAYGFGFMGFALVKVLVPGFYARQETKLPVRFATIGLGVGMLLSLTSFIAARSLKIEGAHVGLALSTSLTAWVNSILLYRRLRSDGVYKPSPGWGRFGLRLLAANGLMAAAALYGAGNLAEWTALDALTRALRLGAVIAGCGAVYFLSLWALGLRPRHLLMGRRGGAV